MKHGLVTLALLAGCTDGSLQYGWDDRNVLCSFSVDDLSQSAPWGKVSDEMDYAADHASVALMHAHKPGETISVAAIERILDEADAHHLTYLTYSDLVPATPRAGLALCFDDSAVDAWYAQRDLFAAHNAHVTFFVTRYANWTDAEHAELAELAAAGHDIEAHGVNHLNAPDYVDAHGMAAYLTDEALPSIDILDQAGYAVTSYAFPFGASTDALDDALLEHVARVRVSPGSCPN